MITDQMKPNNGKFTRNQLVFGITHDQLFGYYQNKYQQKQESFRSMKSNIKKNIGEHDSLESFGHDEVEQLTKKAEEELRQK